LGNARNLVFWVVLFLLVLALFNLFSGGSNTQMSNAKSYSEFVEAVENSAVSQVTLDGEQVRYRGTDGRDYVTIKPQDAEVTSLLIAEGIPVTAQSQETSALQSFLLGLLPFLLLIGVWIYFMNRMQGGGKGGAMGFGKSKAKLLTEKHGRVTFDEVAGMTKPRTSWKRSLNSCATRKSSAAWAVRFQKVRFWWAPRAPVRHCLRAPSPARLACRSSRFPVPTLSKRVRDMFEQAKKNAPCIVFIDEIDAVGRSRGAGYGGGNDEREQTLNQLLVEMDGFEANEGIIIIAATNRPDVLDPALLRPGRFDRQVQVPNPDIKGREKILGVHARKVPLGPDVDLRIIARGTPGFSGADLANLVNESALTAARVGRRFVTMIDFENAKDKVMMGAERRSMVMTEDEKKLTAYHEAGHAIVGLNVPQHDPIHKATIIPRGRALGLVLSLPERDQLSVSLTKYTSKIAMAMGGRVAEELIFGPENVTSGAASDIQQVSKIARAMVTQFGFSEELGYVDYANEQSSYLGNYGGGTNHSAATQKIIDDKVKELVDAGYETAKRILTEKADDLERLAQGLLEYETLTGSEITKVIAGVPLNRGDDAEDDTPPSNGNSVTAIPKTKPKKPKATDGGMEPEPTA